MVPRAFDEGNISYKIAEKVEHSRECDIARSSQEFDDALEPRHSKPILATACVRDVTPMSAGMKVTDRRACWSAFVLLWTS